MTIFRRTQLVALIAILTVADCSASFAKDEATLTVEQRQQVRVLIADFRRHRNDDQKRTETVDQLLQIGGPAVTLLQEAAKKELFGQMKVYGSNFRRTAASLYRSHLANVKVDEVQQLRQTVLALKENPNLTKEMIVDKADPAMTRLNELLVIPREAVLENEALQEQRSAILVSGTHWQRCVRHLEDLKLPEDGDDGTPFSFDEYLLDVETIAAQQAMPMKTANRSMLASNARVASRLDPEEARAIVACNLMRNLLGLNVLKIDTKLCAAARGHSADMQRLKFFAHDSPVDGKTTPWDRAKRAGTTASAENIAGGMTDGQTAHLGWFYSPPHHKNLLGKFKRIGIGRADRNFTEMFGN